MKQITQTVEFPHSIKAAFKKAVFYEKISLLYMISAALLSFLVMSNSQTMKTVWLEDTLGIIPPLSLLISSKMIRRRANKTFPYGFHRVPNMAYFSSSLALFGLGLFLLIDGAIVLLKQEHPSIPTLFFFDYSIWLGFIMMMALAWSSVPSTVLGHIKIPLAQKLHDKSLYADSKMNKASWMSGFASMFGVLGIGFGYWWADAVVGMLISLNILNDGFTNLKNSILDLLDEVPKTLEGTKTEPLIQKVKNTVLKENWVNDVELRFRDEGHVLFGDVFILTNQPQVEIKKIKQLQDSIKNMHWRLHDITIIPVKAKMSGKKGQFEV